MKFTKQQTEQCTIAAIDFINKRLIIAYHAYSRLVKEHGNQITPELEAVMRDIADMYTVLHPLKDILLKEMPEFKDLYHWAEIIYENITQDQS